MAIQRIEAGRFDPQAGDIINVITNLGTTQQKWVPKVVEENSQGDLFVPGNGRGVYYLNEHFYDKFGLRYVGKKNGVNTFDMMELPKPLLKENWQNWDVTISIKKGTKTYKYVRAPDKRKALWKAVEMWRQEAPASEPQQVLIRKLNDQEPGYLAVVVQSR